jgi:hypothetical protein
MTGSTHYHIIIIIIIIIIVNIKEISVKGYFYQYKNILVLEKTLFSL